MKHREATCSWMKQKQYFHRGYSDELWTFGDWLQCMKWWQIKMENWYCIILRSCTIMCACWVPMIYLFYLVFLFRIITVVCFKIMNHYESLFIILFWIMLVGLSVDDTALTEFNVYQYAQSQVVLSAYSSPLKHSWIQFLMKTYGVKENNL